MVTCLILQVVVSFSAKLYILQICNRILYIDVFGIVFEGVVSYGSWVDADKSEGISRQILRVYKHKPEFQVRTCQLDVESH